MDKQQEISELFSRADKGDLSVMEHPDVDNVKDDNGLTPLQRLSRSGVIEKLSCI